MLEFKNANTAAAAACKRIVFLLLMEFSAPGIIKKKCASFVPNFKFNTAGTLVMNCNYRPSSVYFILFVLFFPFFFVLFCFYLHICVLVRTSGHMIVM